MDPRGSHRRLPAPLAVLVGRTCAGARRHSAPLYRLTVPAPPGGSSSPVATDAASYVSITSSFVDDLDYCGRIGLSGQSGNKVEGLVRGFPGGGSSPLRRMKAPHLRGFRLLGTLWRGYGSAYHI